MAGTLVAEALAKGDMGLAVAGPRSGCGRDRPLALGHRPAADDVPARRSPATTSRPPALALNEPAVLFDVLAADHDRDARR